MMNEYNYDYWNDADQNTIDYSAVEALEDKVSELEQVIEDMKTDELYILYHMIKARDKLYGKPEMEAVYKELGELIGLHGWVKVEKAKLYTGSD